MPNCDRNELKKKIETDHFGFENVSKNVKFRPDGQTLLFIKVVV